MNKIVEIIKVQETDQFEGTVIFRVNDHQYEAFYWGDNFEAGEKVNVTLTQLEHPLRWEEIFTKNKGQEIKIEKSKSSERTYDCYGKIESIKPIVADFGDLQFELGDWTSDQKVIGENIFWTIDRIDIKRVE